jgi:hypothetical protein
VAPGRGFPTEGFGQLRDEFLNLPGVRAVEKAQKHVRLDGGVHDRRALRSGADRLQLASCFEPWQLQETTRVIVGVEQRCDVPA